MLAPTLVVPGPEKIIDILISGTRSRLYQIDFDGQTLPKANNCLYDLCLGSRFFGIFRQVF